MINKEKNILEEKLKSTPKQKEKIFKNSSSSNAKKTTNKNPKNAIVKLISKMNSEGLKSGIYYIEKTADKLINEEGEEKTPIQVYNEWEKDFNKKNPIKSVEAWHMIFSINEPKNSKNIEALEKSFLKTFENKFDEYKFVYAIHTHQNNPHIHVIINTNNKYNGKKLQIKNNEFKLLFQELRQDFAENLNYYNKELNYTATKIIEKDLKFSLLKKEVEKLNNNSSIFNKLIHEAKEEIKIKQEEYINIDNSQKSFLKDLKFNLLQNKDSIIIQKNSLHKLIKRADFIKKEILSNEKLIENLNQEFRGRNSPKNLEEELKYFNRESQINLLSLKQVQVLKEIKKNWNQSKELLNKSYDNKIFNSKELQLKFLVDKYNSFTIRKYQNQINKEIEIFVSLGKDIRTLRDNKEFLDELLKKRVDIVPIMISKQKSKLILEKDVIKKERLESSISFLENEKNLLDKIATKGIHTVKDKDLTNFIKELEIKVYDINNKTSSFKIVDLYNEVNIRLQNNNLDETKKDILLNSEKRLVKAFEDRDKNTLIKLSSLTKVSNIVKDRDQKEAIKKKLEFVYKEREFIKNWRRKVTMNNIKVVNKIKDSINTPPLKK